MANAVKKAYSELFMMYPDAYKKDDETLKNFLDQPRKLENRW